MSVDVVALAVAVAVAVAVVTVIAVAVPATVVVFAFAAFFAVTPGGSFNFLLFSFNAACTDNTAMWSSILPLFLTHISLPCA